MPKVISGNNNYHEIIAECEFVLEGVFISPFVCLGKTWNSRYDRYKYIRFFLKPKILLYVQNDQWFRNSIFPKGKHIFPDLLLNS